MVEDSIGDARKAVNLPSVLLDEIDELVKLYPVLYQSRADFVRKKLQAALLEEHPKYAHLNQSQAPAPVMTRTDVALVVADILEHRDGSKSQKRDGKERILSDISGDKQGD